MTSEHYLDSDARDRAEKRRKTAERADQLLTMTPDEHRREAARLMSVQTSITNEVAILLRAQLHLQFAAVKDGAR